MEKDLKLEIWDDGVGASSAKERGIGLDSMQERAQELGGSFVLRSSPEGGTRISVSLPVDWEQGLEPV